MGARPAAVEPLAAARQLSSSRALLLGAVAAACLAARTAEGLSVAASLEAALHATAMSEKAAARPSRLGKPSDDEENEEDEEDDDKGEKDEAEDQDEGDKPDEKSEAKESEEDEEDGKQGEDGDEDKERQEDADDKDDGDSEKEEEEAKPSKAKKDSDDDEKEEGKEEDRRQKAKKAKAKSEAKLLKQEPKASPPRKTTNEKGEPIDPGCYVLMPDGCPGKSWGPTPWKRDTWGEANVGAGTDRDVCENKRKIKFNNWCGKNNARMLFVESGPVYPSEPGCFYWHPSGCPAHGKKAAKEWTKDETDEGMSQATCEGQRKAALDKWCGVGDTRTLFVHPKPETPEYPGCYVWMPNGCALHKFDARRGWKRDAWGEDNINAGQDKAVCEKRQLNFNTWCGISDTQMLFVDAKA